MLVAGNLNHLLGYLYNFALGLCIPSKALGLLPNSFPWFLVYLDYVTTSLNKVELNAFKYLLVANKDSIYDVTFEHSSSFNYNLYFYSDIIFSSLPISTRCYYNNEDIEKVDRRAAECYSSYGIIIYYSIGKFKYYYEDYYYYSFLGNSLSAWDIKNYSDVR